MKQGGCGQADNKHAGFTIVETLIVIAVTGMIFVGALTYVSGRQNKTQFMTATNDFLQQLQQLSSETSSGYTQSNQTACAAGNNSQPTFPTGGAALGSNGGCIFLGTVLQLGITGSSGTGHIFPIVGNRLASNGGPVSNLADAYPIAMPVANGGSDLTPEDGLQLYSMTYMIGSSTPQITRGVGFITSLGVGSDSLGYTGGSADGLQLMTVSGSGGYQYVSTMRQNINRGSLISADQVQICLNGGGVNQSALYTVGSNSDPTAVNMTIHYNETCA